MTTDPVAAVVAALLACPDREAWRRPSFETLARATGISPGAVRMVARAIEAAGVRLQ